MAIIGIPFRYQELKDRRPILYLSERVRRTIQKAGGEILMLTPVQDVDYFHTRGNEFEELTDREKKIIEKYLDKCDGLFIPGGNKFTPYDRYVLERAIDKKIPTLGVCLGMQIMSFYGESEIKLEENNTHINHKQENDNELTHKVRISNDSILCKILNKEEIMVNSFHTKHASENNIYNTVAYSEDGLIEAIEYPGNFFNMGIQWHPEISYDFDDDSKKIIDYFINEAEKYGNDKRK